MYITLNFLAYIFRPFKNYKIIIGIKHICEKNIHSSLELKFLENCMI